MATDFRDWALRQRAPFTAGLAASLVLFALVGGLTQGRAVGPLALLPGQPWGALTYPWALNPLANSAGLITFIVVLVALFQFGGTVEREMGTSRIALFWLVATLLFAVIAILLGVGLAGLLLPSSALITLWCARNRSARVLLWGILPLSGTVLAAVVAASDVYLMGGLNLLRGVPFALPLGLVWLFGLERLPIPFSAGGSSRSRREQPVVKGGTRYDDAYYENVKKREIEREEQERLRKLFEGK